jgi:predicted  nucleic acid-binding Zn-ribbon protein
VDIQGKLRKEIQKAKHNRPVMMSEIARIRHNLRDRQKRRMQNQGLLQDLRDEHSQTEQGKNAGAMG